MPVDPSAAEATQGIAAQASMRRSQHRSTSQMLQEVAASPGETMTIRDLSARLGDRGFGLMLLLFALPNAIPLPIIGISTLTSLPLIFFSAQLMMGRERVWLPRWLADRQIPTSTLRLIVRKSVPWLMKLETIAKPRLDSLTTHRFERIAGSLMLLLALLIALPIPFGNFPLGLAMAILALAITERDGYAMIAGWLFTLLALCFFLALISGYAWVVWQIISTIVQ